MRILFIFPHIHPYTAESVREKPSGGTEKVVCFLSEALTKLGHECKIVTSLGEFSEVDVVWPEVVITQEAELLQKFEKAKKIWWCHHFPDQPIIQRSSGYARAFADKIVTLSQCQANDFKTYLKLNSIIIGHGVWLNEIDTTAIKDPYRFIYASTPFRGLERIPGLFNQIKKIEPRATIAIASSMATYGQAEADKQYSHIFETLRSTAGVDLLGSLNQQELYKEYAKASIFFYPCTWRETYCLAMDEAIAHGCIPWITNVGALPERANWCDFNIENPLFTGDNPPAGKQPKDWMEVAREWEVLF